MLLSAGDDRPFRDGSSQRLHRMVGATVLFYLHGLWMQRFTADVCSCWSRSRIYFLFAVFGMAQPVEYDISITSKSQADICKSRKKKFSCYLVSGSVSLSQLLSFDTRSCSRFSNAFPQLILTLLALANHVLLCTRGPPLCSWLS